MIKFYIFLRPKLSDFFDCQNIAMFSNDEQSKNLTKYLCEYCKYSTSDKRDYNKHLKTKNTKFRFQQSQQPKHRLKRLQIPRNSQNHINVIYVIKYTRITQGYGVIRRSVVFLLRILFAKMLNQQLNHRHRYLLSWFFKFWRRTRS